MAAPRLLLKTDLAGLQPLLLRGQTVHALHQRLTDQLTARGAPAALFAEPITGAGAISWYGEAAGEPQPLPTLSSARRAEAEAALTRQLQALEPLLDDAEIGPLLRRALVLPNADSILVLDGQVILTGWGLAAREIAEDPAALAAQMRRVLGPYSQRLASAAAPTDGFAAAPSRAQTSPAADGPQASAGAHAPGLAGASGRPLVWGRSSAGGDWVLMTASLAERCVGGLLYRRVGIRSSCSRLGIKKTKVPPLSPDPKTLKVVGLLSRSTAIWRLAGSVCGAVASCVSAQPQLAQARSRA